MGRRGTAHTRKPAKLAPRLVRRLNVQINTNTRTCSCPPWTSCDCTVADVGDHIVDLSESGPEEEKDSSLETSLSQTNENITYANSKHRLSAEGSTREGSDDASSSTDGSRRRREAEKSEKTGERRQLRKECVESRSFAPSVPKRSREENKGVGEPTCTSSGSKYYPDIRDGTSLVSIQCERQRKRRRY